MAMHDRTCVLTNVNSDKDNILCNFLLNNFEYII